MSLEIRTYKDTDPTTAKDRLFLSIVSTKTMGVTIFGPTKKAAADRAAAWIETERGRQTALKPPRLRDPDLAPPPKTKPAKAPAR